MALDTKKATYSEISRLSGISMSTISRILNNTTSVTSDTKEKVFSAMTELGFDISEYLTATAPKSSDLIIFNIPTLDNPFYSHIVQGAKASSTRHKYNLLINEMEITDKTIEAFLELLHTTRAAGIIISNYVEPSLLQKIADTTSIIQCCECDKTLGIPFVTVDDVLAAKSAVRHLISLGKKKISFINGPIHYKYAKDRLTGYREALEQSQTPVDPSLIIQLNEVNYDMAVSAVMQILSSQNRPEAFFCASDVYAAAVIKATRKFGLKVPEDIKVVGFDNVEISTMCNPSITTINQPRYQLGFLSCEMLVNSITNKDNPMQSVYLETELLIRESTTNL